VRGLENADFNVENKDPSEPDLVKLPEDVEVGMVRVEGAILVGEVLPLPFCVEEDDDGPVKDDGREYGLDMAWIRGFVLDLNAPALETVASWLYEVVGKSDMMRDGYI
jgi:hypothetical protein